MRRDSQMRLSAILAAAALAACLWPHASGAATTFGAAPAAAPAAAKPKKALLALTAYDIDAQRLLAPPPADDSNATRAELAELRLIIAARTPERFAQARWDDEHEDPSAFYQVIGGGFDLQRLPATAALMAVVMNDEAVAAKAAKKTYPRKRPWAVDATIPNCDPDDKPLTSYPSGHAMMGYTAAIVFASLMPEKAPAIQARARDYAFSREVCGAHFASDTEASHALAEAVAAALLASPQLQPKIAAARAELRGAGFTGR